MVISLRALRRLFDEYAELAERQGAWIKPNEFNRFFFNSLADYPLRDWQRALERQGRLELKQDSPGSFWYFRGKAAGANTLCLKELMVRNVRNTNLRIWANHA